VPLDTTRDTVLVFGRETGGLPADLHERFRDRFVGLPILSSRIRSLNLSTSVAIAVYDVLRRRQAR
jgi:tRNA (cytidine/uridine-2'-O-)-methyltransferase